MIEKKNVYKGSRYVPKVLGVWNQLAEYEGLTVVTWEGNSYTSKKRVPAGVEITNEEYWVVTGNYNAQVEQYRNQVKELNDRLAEYELDTDEILNKKLYFFNTVEDMLNSELSVGESCMTKGFYKKNDGGKSFYTVASSLEFTANGINILAGKEGLVFVLDVISPKINIAQLGAKALKGFDNSEIILKAAELCSMIVIPIGGFECSIDLTTIDRKAWIFQGMTSPMQWGEDSTPMSRLIFNGATTDDYIIKNYVWEENDVPGSIAIRNITFDGNNKSGNGLQAGDSPFVENCEFTSCLVGIHKVRMGSITKTVIKKCDAGIRQLTDSRVSDSMIHHCLKGIHIINSNSNVYVNNKIEWNIRGVEIEKSVFNNFQSNTFDRSTEYGIYGRECTYLTLVGNTFERNMIYQLDLSGAQFLITANFFIRKNTEDTQTGVMLPDIHIRFRSISNVTVTGNTFNGGKEFYGTTEYTDKVFIEGNTKDGVGEEVNVSIPSTDIPAGQTVSITVPYPTDFYDTTNVGSDYTVIYSQIRRNGSSFPRIYNSAAYQLEQYNENLLVRYTNSGTSTVSIGGFIRLKQTNWNKR